MDYAAGTVRCDAVLLCAGPMAGYLVFSAGWRQVDVDYQWLRGTRDDGTYTVVNRVIFNKAGRGLRKTPRVGLAALELISQVCTVGCALAPRPLGSGARKAGI